MISTELEISNNKEDEEMSQSLLNQVNDFHKNKKFYGDTRKQSRNPF